MKTTTLITISLLLLSCWGFAQEADSVKRKNSKTSRFTFFNTEITMYENSEGIKTWEFLSKGYDHYEEYQTKGNKSDNGLTMDIGINTWASDAPAPQIKPWGSWNPAINYYSTYKPSRNFSLKSTLGVSWYNFKFEDRNLQALRSPDGLVFEEHPSETGIMSKISASYANLTILPTITSSNGNWGIGVGGYAGYRLGGRGKFVYRDDNANRAKEFQLGNMFANNFRYGLRTELTVADVTFYLNYDLNNTFQENKGPKLNAISFGLVL